MCALGFRGVERGWRVKTTTPVAKPECPANRVNRVFRATRRNALYVADLTDLTDLTDVATWAGSVYLAFVINAYAR